MRAQQLQGDTIVAQATMSGQAGIGIVRLSGEHTHQIAKRMLHFSPQPRYAHYAEFCDLDGTAIDQGIALYYPAPNSFTGEDVLEFHAHGSDIVLAMLIDTCIALGARLAEAGEFSKRAFLNGKIDLVQAEAIADLIAASSQQSARAAMRSLKGKFSDQINQFVSHLIKLRVEIEAEIDFADENLSLNNNNKQLNQLSELHQQLDALLAQANQGQILSQGIDIVIAGQPNSGKSSLFNALSRHDSAIVTELAGTTRDALSEDISLNGMPARIMDTAGLHTSSNVIEQEGIRRAKAAITHADIVLLVYDARTDINQNILPESLVPQHIIYIKNKIDLINAKPEVIQSATEIQVAISAKYQLGIDLLIKILVEKAGINQLTEHTLLARKRHINALKTAKQHLNDATSQFKQSAIELAGEELRLAQQALNTITGEFSADDLLGEIFSNFCIGK